MTVDSFISFTSPTGACEVFDTPSIYSNPLCQLRASENVVYFNVAATDDQTKEILVNTLDGSPTTITNVEFITNTPAIKSAVEILNFDSQVALASEVSLGIRFRPTTEIPSTRCLLRITCSWGVLDIQVILSTVEEFSLDVPLKLNFATTKVGELTVSYLALTNTAIRTLGVINGATISMSLGGSEFELDTSQFPIFVAPGATEHLTITFTPAHNSVRKERLTLHIPNNNSPIVVALEGTGIDAVGFTNDTSAVVLTEIPPTPEELSLFQSVNQVTVGSVIPYMVYFKNFSTSRLLVDNATISNNSLSEFSLVYPDAVIQKFIEPLELFFIAIQYNPVTTTPKYPSINLTTFPV